jgi:hypothetical protein
MSIDSGPKRTSPEGESKRYERIDRKSTEILAALAEAPVFRKQGEVHARRALAGEKITTVLANGMIETVNTAHEGDWIVTNVSGEEYIPPAENFNHRYAPTDREGIYKCEGFCRAIQNPFGKPIEILASWGEIERGTEDCMIADTCDEEGNDMANEPYLINKAEFIKIYKVTGV